MNYLVLVLDRADTTICEMVVDALTPRDAAIKAVRERIAESDLEDEEGTCGFEAVRVLTKDDLLKLLRELDDV